MTDWCQWLQFDRGLHRWVDAMTTERMNISHWRKSSQWFSLLREHAEIVIKDTEIAASFAEYCYPTNTEGRYRYDGLMSVLSKLTLREA